MLMSLESLSEVLFELGGFQIVRGVFISLAPPYTPHPDLINTSAMIASLKAMRNKAARIWYFPYDFATAVLADAPISQLQNSSEGQKGILRIYTLRLKCYLAFIACPGQVFVPIWEAGDAWYVMLLDVKASKIYALDVNRSSESIVRRESNMNKICHALRKMFVHSRNLINFRHTNPDPSNWGHFIYPQAHNLQYGVYTGYNTMGASLLNFSATWSVNQPPPDLISFGNSEHVRMRAALNIVHSDVNQCRGFIDCKAEVVWRVITSCNDKNSVSRGSM
ncbi:uncharacterized protein DS421_4g122900 [Arachis hypogaea]|nr:uncharacterized protein DS421_4g122900 [Arachis hypogaea]